MSRILCQQSCNVTYFESNRMTENVCIEFIIFENKYIILYIFMSNRYSGKYLPIFDFNLN